MPLFKNTSKYFSFCHLEISTLSFHFEELSTLMTEKWAVVQSYSVKNVFLKIWQNPQQNTCALPESLFNKVNLAQVFSCEFCEIFKNIFFKEYLWWLLLTEYNLNFYFLGISESRLKLNKTN